MPSNRFLIRVDGRDVWIDQATREVTILDGDGRSGFRERIQVAAGSVQGLFTAALGGGISDVSEEPAPRA